MTTFLKDPSLGTSVCCYYKKVSSMASWRIRAGQHHCFLNIFINNNKCAWSWIPILSDIVFLFLLFSVLKTDRVWGPVTQTYDVVLIMTLYFYYVLHKHLFSVRCECVYLIYIAPFMHRIQLKVLYNSAAKTQTQKHKLKPYTYTRGKGEDESYQL